MTVVLQKMDLKSIQIKHKIYLIINYYRYGLARAMILKAEKERSNKILLESIEILKEVISLFSVTKTFLF